MNLSRIALAALGGFVAYFALGGLAFGLFPLLRNEFLKYPAVYRSQEALKSVMPGGMAAMFVGIQALAVIYATSGEEDAGYKKRDREQDGRNAQRVTHAVHRMPMTGAVLRATARCCVRPARGGCCHDPEMQRFNYAPSSRFALLL